MQLPFRSLVLVAGTLLASGTASTASASGHITFFGELTAATCFVHGVDKPDVSGNFSVNLPTLSAPQLEHVGVAAGHTRFGLQLRDCTGTNPVQAFFEAGPFMDTVNNTIRPTNDGPIHFALFDEEGRAIRIGDLTSQSAARQYQPNERMFFDVAYVRVAPGPITPGAFTGLVTYSLMYR
ncbi:hypothetical protein LYSHEL_20890 [Lysobacter helvus]|uniref:Fimbrial-type adhesion domain-containing protein n=2 Tax=Lysobacteraceae TaxID=32033 RepID=A0ABM7Q6R6_9GAMM|nr:MULTISPECIES: fimbrial protein [Lysobacter]BCT93066.1 hypothetical protein LYSCAS_20900 [Lysobacter caseinilyticus]BCT96218.1 hypothetical protein LYSHEL_20890 [Lysobacter helvus]